jgi:hypothetical protein
MSKIISGHGPQREARYQDELVDCPSAARRTPTPTPFKNTNTDVAEHEGSLPFIPQAINGHDFIS